MIVRCRAAQTSRFSKSAAFLVAREEPRSLGGRDFPLPAPSAHESAVCGSRQPDEKPLTRHAPADESAGA
jgi:hypothetical protein